MGKRAGSADSGSGHGPVKKSGKKSGKPADVSNSESALLSNNRFSALANGAEPFEKRVKIPPIFTTKDVPSLLIELHKANLRPNFKLCSVGSKIVCSNLEQFEGVKNYLKVNKLEYYTHDVVATKPTKVVLRGLPTMNVKHIKEELEKLQLKPEAIFPMSRHNKDITYRDCLYLVHLTRGSVNMATLKNIKALFSIIVEWEQYRPQHRDVTQCSNCQAFGHGTKNCQMKPRCSKCAGLHLTTACELMEDAANKCVNCDGNHLASSKTCPKRAGFVKIRQQASTRNQPNRKKVPQMDERNYPSLPSRRAIPVLQPLPLNERLAAAAAEPDRASSSFSVPSKPPGWENTQPQVKVQPEASGDLFSAEQLVAIFQAMATKLRSCKTRFEQINTLGSFIIEYAL